ncbi:uncharacterized protein [Amphiura filiformis]|uniref:uncharacterized protein n=1 Tax=Amphiura filiformis TaxID=82378 RepID=UPI003B219640
MKGLLMYTFSAQKVLFKSPTCGNQGAIFTCLCDHDDSVPYKLWRSIPHYIGLWKGDKTKSIIIIKENVSNINAAMKSGELPHLVIFNETNYIVGDGVNIQCTDSSAGAFLQLIAL